MFQTQVCETAGSSPRFFLSFHVASNHYGGKRCLPEVCGVWTQLYSLHKNKDPRSQEISVEMAPSSNTQAGHTMAPWHHQAPGALLTLVAFLSCKWSVGTKSFLLCLVTVTLSLPPTSAHPHTQPCMHTYTHHTQNT